MINEANIHSNDFSIELPQIISKVALICDFLRQYHTTDNEFEDIDIAGASAVLNDVEDDLGIINNALYGEKEAGQVALLVPNKSQPIETIEDTTMENLVELINQKSLECESIIDTCNCKLQALSNAFDSMSEKEPKVNLVFWDGLKAFCNDMITQLCTAHDLTDEIRTYADKIETEPAASEAI